MEETIFLFYKHFNTFKGKTRSVYFPSLVYEKYFVPIDENTFASLLEKIEFVYNNDNMKNHDKRTVKLFEKIVHSLYHVNIHEFE